MSPSEHDPPPLLPQGPPELPGAAAAKRRSFWRSPLGVLAAISVILGVLVVVSSVAFGLAVRFGSVPDVTAVEGGDLHASVVSLLRDHGVVGPDETVHYYYSAGVFDHLADGHLISDARVVWFWREDGREEVEVYSLVYEEITDIRVQWGEGFLGETIVTVVAGAGSEAELWIPNYEDGDRAYHGKLRELWQKYR